MSAFTRLSPHTLYYWDVAFTDYTIAFLPLAESSAWPSSLTLDQTWATYPGIYLFLNGNVSNEAALTQAVWDFIGSSPVRFLWIENPEEAVNEWVAYGLPIADGKVATRTQFIIGESAFMVGAGCAVTLPNNGLVFAFTPSSTGSVYYMAQNVSIPISGNLQLTFDGAAGGSWQFTLPFTTADQWQSLGVSCRYASDDPNWSETLRYFTYPILGWHTGLNLYATLDPINLLRADRSFMNFLSAPTQSQTPIPSGFRSIYGEPLTLRPIISSWRAQGPSLVYAGLRGSTVSPVEDYYLVPHGSFQIAGTTSHNTNLGFMCGLFGGEYMQINLATQNILHFFAGMSAYAPGFGKTATSDNSTPLLTDTVTTAWAFLSGSQAVTYFAQPQDSGLYQPPGQSSQTPHFLLSLNPPVGTLSTNITPPGGSGQATAVPLVPYGLVSGESVNELRAFESGILTPARRALLNNLLNGYGTQPDGSGRITATTPQGLMFTFDTTLHHLTSLILGQFQNGTQKLQFNNVIGDFKAALQSNQLFMVVSNATVLTQNCTVGSTFGVTIEGWHFNLDPQHWGTPAHTMMLMKYNDHAITELVNQTEVWAWPAAAGGYAGVNNSTIQTVQHDLQTYIQNVLTLSATQPEMANFYDDVLNNPNWNGVLFLNVNLDFSALPDALQGLAAGIDSSRFYAHHLGLNATPIQMQSSILSQQDTSFFGLINYSDPEHLAYAGNPYDYKVRALKVVFENSAIATFTSQVELMIAALFDETATLINAPSDVQGNNLLLDGYYQNQNGVAAYAFVQVGSNLFRMQQQVLDNVEITRAQFSTLADVSNSVEAQFVLAGHLRFMTQADFDMYSFGNTYTTDSDGNVTQTAEGGLSFSNLLIRVAYNPSTQERTFTFDASHLSFDLKSSVARVESLYNHFPLKLTQLRQSVPNTTPGDMGYISVASPLQQAGLTNPWYALIFDLNLGTFGALAGNLGFVVQLVAAWGPAQPGDTSPKVYVGLKLPGSNSANAQIPIEGVLKLSMRAIEFTANPDSEGRPNYILRFRAIALTLLMLSFPPGQTDLYIFGDPARSRSDTLAWYAAYAKEEKKS